MKIVRMTSPVVPVSNENLEATVAFYERLLGAPARARFKNPAGTLDIVPVGSMLVIAGDPDALASRLALKATFIVDSLGQWREEIERWGATIVEPPARGPVSASGPIGAFMFVRHPDGALFEYFEPDA
jgi:catechol 2,3-dioxygenase-like lactoylglutathione lyase family enzyme